MRYLAELLFGHFGTYVRVHDWGGITSLDLSDAAHFVLSLSISFTTTQSLTGALTLLLSYVHLCFGVRQEGGTTYYSFVAFLLFEGLH